MHHERRWFKPAWERVNTIDAHEHLSRWLLPEPGGTTELTDLVARLHSQKLDFSRPLWECHLIDGLAGGRFAIYLKMHHSLADGGSVVRMLTASLAEHAGPFSLEEVRERHRSLLAPAAPATVEPARVRDTVKHVATRLLRLIRASRRRDDPQFAIPYRTPATPLHSPIDATRAYAIQSIELDRLRRVQDATGATLNDLLLAACAQALRRYLRELDALPAKPLLAGVPVALERPPGSAAQGNEVAAVYVVLPTHLDDVREQLEFVRTSMRKAREQVLTMPKQAIQLYSDILAVPFATMQMLHLGALIPSFTNLAISNVTGPRQTLYFHGSRLEHMYPASVVFDGQALNVTVRSCSGWLNFGLVACPARVPRLQRLADYVIEGFDVWKT